MTQDNRSGRPQGRPPEGDGRVSRVEASLRGPFLLFFVSAVVWLLAASVLGVIAALQQGAFGFGPFHGRDESLTSGDFRLTAVEVSTERIRRIRVERIADIPTL